MNVRTLELQAFGPFKGKELIDFDQVNQEGKFLLTGQSGAGKTTILDAIFFALYGGLPGNRRKVATDKYKSRFADDETVPYVELVFVHNNKEYKIRREPKYYKSRKGVYNKNATAGTVEFSVRQEGKWKALAQQVGDAATELQKVIPLTADQFSQIVLLPQGKFDAFLRANSEDRKKILQAIFPVYTYQQLMEWFDERQKVEKKKTEAVEKNWDETQKTALALGDSLALGSEEKVGIDEYESYKPDALRKFFVEIQKAGSVLQKHHSEAEQEAKKKITQAHKALNEVKQLQEDRLFYANVTKEQEAIEEGKSEYHRDKASREHHSKAVPLVEEKSRVDRESEEATLAKAAYVDAIDSLKDSSIISEKELEEKNFSKAIQKLSEELGELGKIKDEQGKKEKNFLDNLTARQEDLATATQENKDQVKKAKQAFTKANKKLSQDMETKTSQREAAQKKHKQSLKDQEKKSQEVKEFHASQIKDSEEKASREEKEYRKDVSKQEKALEKAVAECKKKEEDLLQGVKTSKSTAKKKEKKLKTAETELDALRSHQREQLAALLAETLTPGDDCPTCGSKEHPKPAKVDSSEKITDEDIETAEDAVNLLRSEIQKLVSKEEQAQEKLIELKEQLKLKKAETKETLASLEERFVSAKENSTKELEKLRKNHEKVEKQAEIELRKLEEDYQADQEMRKAEIVSLEESLQTAQKEQEEQLKELQEAFKVKKKVLDEKIEVATTQLDECKEEFKKTTGGKDITVVIEEKKDSIAMIEDVSKLKTRHEEARKAVKKAEESLASKLEKSIFETQEDAIEALLDEDTFKELEKAISAFEKRETLLENSLKDERYLKAKKEIDEGIKLPSEEELEKLGKDAEIAEAEHKETNQKLGAVKNTLTSLTKLEQNFENQMSDNEETVERAAKFQALAATVSGTNLKKMDLLTYVLAARLEKIAEAASQHLLKMSDGRYKLLYTDKADSGKERKIGLGIEVLDNYNTERRQVVTLSGGETFLASLSLALGLADVIRAENGGIQLETLFIDEGFGSLDQDTLSDVLSTLDGLVQDNRTLCMISHVSEMKESGMPFIEVIKGQDGSKILVDPQNEAV